MKDSPLDRGRRADQSADQTSSATRLADTVHALRNGLAGVRGAVQVVREPMAPGMEREILGEVLQRLDDMDRLVLALAASGGGAPER